MKQFIRGIGGVVILLGLAGTQAAFAQTSYGDNGLFIHPTADINARHDIRLNVSYLNIPSSSANDEENWIPVNVTVPVNSRVQWGATYVDRIVHRTSFGSGGLFGKYQLVSETDKRPAVAVAASFLGGNLKLVSYSLVASKDITACGHTLGTLHIGGQYVHWHDNDSNSGDERAFVGTNVPITNRFNFIGELGSRLNFDTKASSSLGIQFNDGRGMSVGTGYVNNGRGQRGGFFFGIGRPIGGD
jgi:hypothetical protein